jgi:ectoine hydroxylase-related dioxygenase (phytanoyl-CoA dioxygenase family)
VAVSADRLERIHGPVTGLFPSPPAAAEASRFALSADAVAFFHEHGYVKGGRVLDDAQIEALRSGLEAIRRGDNPRTAELYEIDDDYRRAPEANVFHFLGAWLIDDAFHDLLWHPAVSVKAAQLLGVPRARFWHDQVFYKPARHPGVVTWHQDYSYWTRATPPGHVTCWIGLDDSTLENGCLMYVPGSHRWGLLPRISLTKDMDAVRPFLEPAQAEAFRPEPMILRAGECTFHHSHTVHGSYGNRTDGPRRGVVLNFMRPDTRSADGAKPLLAGVLPVPEGAVIQGDYFPLL